MSGTHDKCNRNTGFINPTQPNLQYENKMTKRMPYVYKLKGNSPI